MKAWDVYDKDDFIIDTVFYDDDCSAWYVHHGLINHDDYHAEIKVECKATGERWPDGD